LLHPVSLLIPFMILLPNLAFARLQPRSLPGPHESKENPILVGAERVGQLGAFVLPLFYTIHIETAFEKFSFAGMVLFLALYYLGWMRYFSGDREYKLLFKPMLGVPVPMAIGPVMYFLLASIVLHAPFLLICSAVFALGHIPISLNTYQRTGQGRK